MLDTFTLQTFTPLVGSTFDLQSSEEVYLELELTDALSTGTAAASVGGREPFSLTFRGPGEPLLSQGTFRISHGALGSFELFIVPIGRDGDGSRYEAVFT